MRRSIAVLAIGAAFSIAAIACGSDDGAPAAGDNPGGSEVPTQVPAPNLSGVDALIAALRASGAVVADVTDEQSGTFNAPVRQVLLNGETVEFYEFTDPSAADAASETVSSDGMMITRDDTPPIAIDFLHPPHYYIHENVIVVYTGGDSGVVSVLREMIGEEFAGDRSPIDPGSGNGSEPGYATVLEPAPIESVVLQEDQDEPGLYSLIVRTGLPNGCASFHNISVAQTGELELTLTALNRVPAPGELIACTDDYRIVDHTVVLGSASDNLDVCEVYTVRWERYTEANSLDFQVLAPNVRCAPPTSDDDPVVQPPVDPPSGLPDPGGFETVLAPAPIVSVGDVVIAESFPPQYFVEIVSAQPSGCDKDAGWSVEIDGNDVHVTVQNTQPANLAVVLCLAIYGETVHNVRLGSGEFESGQDYNLFVNSEPNGTFTAQ